jgi:hypothetical protein
VPHCAAGIFGKRQRDDRRYEIDVNEKGPMYTQTTKTFQHVTDELATLSADRQLPNSGIPPETRPLAWAIPIGILFLLYAVSFLTLPRVEAALHERAVELGWIAR